MGDDFLNSLKQTITETAEVVGKKTEDIVEIQKLRNKLRSAGRNVEMDYRKIGEIIFQRFSDGEVMDEELAEICDGIGELKKQMQGYKEELAGRKGQNICASCGTLNPQNAVFCMQCGAMMPVKEEYQNEKQEFSEETQTEECVTSVQPEEEVAHQDEEEAQKEVWEACTEVPEAETGEEEK